MANEQPKWKSINMGEILPCQSFLRKKDGEILKLSTIGGVKVGQDCYYLPVDEVINVIKDYPVEESEDERIINNIKKVIGWYRGIFTEKSLMPEEYQEIDAWLEKQGEQKPVNKAKIGEKYVCVNCPRYTCFITGCVYEVKDSFMAALIGLCSNCFELYEVVDEQQVEPKFKVGDWIVRDLDNTCYKIKNCILNVTNNKYGYDLTSGGYISSQDANFYHLWTIQDAKDGDVLAAHECYVIFKEIDGLNIKCYCTYHFMNNPSFYVDTLQNKLAFQPATKEQRAELEKAMTDAGYTFDFEKKELKKIEQKPVELGENRSKELSLSLQIQAYLNTASDELYAKEKPLYSEERLEDIHKCMLMWQKLHNAYFYQKPTWSEEDETYSDLVITAIKLYYTDDKGEENPWREELLRWFKSLKDRVQHQSHWKPSDEHIHWLKWAINRMPDTEIANDAEAELRDLLEQLNKLREE